MDNHPGLQLKQFITQIDDQNANFVEAITEPLGYEPKQIVIMIESALEALQCFKAEVEAR